MGRLVARPWAATALALAALLPTAGSTATLTLGPRGAQSLIAEQLFNRHGRWYLIDDEGVCFTYLDTPRTRLEAGRLVLNAHLTSRLGQRMGNNCAGGDFVSNITLSGRLRAADHVLVLEDIRIDRVDDDATRSALTLALQLAPQSLPREVNVDLMDVLRGQFASAQGLPLRLDAFHAQSVATRPEGITLQFDLSLSSP